LGLVVPANFDQALEGIEQPGDLQLPDLEGYLCWGKRFEAGALRSKLEGQISQLLGRPVHIAIEGNIVYPPSESGLSVGLVMLNSVVLILMIGIALVPHLLFEEKQTKTLEALLVSPASIGQVVAGKALAGFFYILVTGGIMLAINWADIVHWDVVILFVMGGGLFAVAVGLLLGSFFSNPQDTTGWVGVLLLVFIGTIFVKMLGVELPAVFRVILPWVPSVALAEVCRAAFSESVSLSRLMSNLGIVLAISLPLYGLVVWKVHRSDQ
jgi:ABC-2 type transport system permease protein